MEAGDRPTDPSPRPGPAPALSAPFVQPCRRLDSGGAPAAAASALLRPSSSAPTRGPSSTARKKLPPCPPAGPPLPQPKPAAKMKTAAPRAKKGAAQDAAERPPPTTCRQPATSLAAGCAAHSTAVGALQPFDEMPSSPLRRRRSPTSPAMEASHPPPRPGRVPSLSARITRPRRRLDSGGTPSATVTAPALLRPSSSAARRGPSSTTRNTPCPQAGPPLHRPNPAPPSSRRALAASTSTPPQAQQISGCWGVPAVSQHGARDHRRPGTTRSELEILNPSALERGEVHTRTCQSDQLCQEEAAAVTHIAPSADLADDLLVNGVLPQLPDDLLVEILSRLPAKPVHRFKCVSKSWRDLISSPHHRKRLPQALAGFFYRSWCPGEKGHEKLQFINLSLRGPPLVNPALAFLPNHASFVLADCCNGLLLLFSSYSQPRDYIVCNPANEKWVALPNSGVTGKHWFSALAFDPAVSSHFHVSEYVDEVTHGNMRIFSSRTGGWSHSVQVFGGCCLRTGGSFHPECNTIFYPRSHEKGISFMSYDLDRGELCHIAAPEFFCTAIDRLLPYVPFFGDIGI